MKNRPILHWGILHIYFNKRKRGKSIKNEIFEIPFNEEKTISILIPDIQNKAFRISKWFVKVGGFVEEGQVICELETNSITLEFERYISGKLVLITNSKEKLKTGEELCKIEEI